MQRVLVVEDDAALREAVVDTLRLAGFEVLAEPSAEDALTCLAATDVDIVVSDVNMGGMDGIELLRQLRATYRQLPVLLITAFADVEKAVTAMHLGAVDFMMKPFVPADLVSRIRQHTAPGVPQSLITGDPRSERLAKLARQVAASDTTVLLTGESGVGKEVWSRFIHDNSARRDADFVAINCAAIPENMLEATLFGHEKGAYTGAHGSRAGKFEQADGGTLLLDEISEMDLSLQAKLLRVLQEREVERLGGKSVRKVDVRVIATTNRHLPDAVKAGEFREDLFYRISVFPLQVEPLRDRPGDIMPIARHLFAQHAQRQGRAAVQLDDTAINELCAHRWPGNVRELDNVVQRALILQQGDVIFGTDLMLDVWTDPLGVAATVGEVSVPGLSPSLGQNMKQQEYQVILDVLRDEDGSRTRAAERLGISPRTLRYKLAQMRESGIDLDKALVA